MLNFDHTRLPRLQRDWNALIDAIVAAEPEDEQDWLEWKSQYDLKSKEAISAIARCIVAMANRAPDLAAATVEGHGLLVIGASPGGRPGVQPRDTAELEEVLTRLLGTDGPRWYPVWCEGSQGKVLIIVVDPPRDGDRIHTIRKDALNLVSGAIYIRAGAKSRPARAEDLDQLSRRLLAGRTKLDFEVYAESAEPPSAVTGIDAYIETWIDRTRSSLMQPLWRERAANYDGDDPARRLRAQELQAAEVLRGIGKSFEGLLATDPESRTEEEFTAEVESYLQDCRTRLPEALRSAAASRLQPIISRIKNETLTNFTAVEVRLHLEGPVQAFRQAEERSVRDLLPASPVPWGPRQRQFFPSFHQTRFPQHHFPNLDHWQTEITNGGSCTLGFPEIDLRPTADEVLDDEIVLLVEGEHPRIRGTWTATATSADGMTSGTIEVVVDGEPLRAEELFD